MVTQSRAAERSASALGTRPLVVGVGGNSHSAGAVVWAAEEAERTGSPVRLVTAVPTDVTPREHQDAAAHGLAGLARRLTLAALDQREVTGRPVEVLLEASEDAALVVVGRRKVGSARRLVVGSTSAALAGRSPVPVVVVPEDWMQPTMSASPIVVGVSTDRHPHHDHVLDFAFDRADSMRVPLVVVSAHEIPSLAAWSPVDLRARRRHAEEALQLRLVPWRAQFPHLEVVARSVAEPAYRAVLDSSRVAQLLVVGRHPGVRIDGFSPTSTTRAVLHHATRPVAVVPAPAEAATRSDAPWADRWSPLY